MNATDQDVLRVKDQRIEELEEALRESVSITAERELAIAQQKQLAQQMEQRVEFVHISQILKISKIFVFTIKIFVAVECLQRSTITSAKLVQ
jgi:hypothetical protein